MSLFMTRKRRDAIQDRIDDLLMSEYRHNCRLQEAREIYDKILENSELKRLEEIRVDISKLQKKLR